MGTSPPPPPPPSGGVGGVGGVGSFTDFTHPDLTSQQLFEISPEAGYKSALGDIYGQQFTGVGPLAGYLQRQQKPLTAAFRGGALRDFLTKYQTPALGGAQPTGAALPGQSFENFLRTSAATPGGLPSAYGQALQDVDYFRGLGQEAIPTGVSRHFAPQSVMDVSEATNLLGAAQRGRYSPLVSGMFQPQSYENLFADYVLGTQERARQQQAPQNFFNFAAQRFGL